MTFWKWTNSAVTAISAQALGHGKLLWCFFAFFIELSFNVCQTPYYIKVFVEAIQACSKRSTSKPEWRLLFSKSFHNLSGRLRVTTQVRSIESLKENPSCMRIDPYKRRRRFQNRRLLQGYDCLPQESTKYFKLIVDGSACIRKICCNNLTDFPKRMSSWFIRFYDTGVIVWGDAAALQMQLDSGSPVHPVTGSKPSGTPICRYLSHFVGSLYKSWKSTVVVITLDRCLICLMSMSMDSLNLLIGYHFYRMQRKVFPFRLRIVALNSVVEKSKKNGEEVAIFQLLQTNDATSYFNVLCEAQNCLGNAIMCQWIKCNSLSQDPKHQWFQSPHQRYQLRSDRLRIK